MLKKPKINIVIGNLVKEDIIQAEAKNPSFWAKENKIYSKLYKKCPSSKFWLGFILEYKLFSLAFLMGKKGDILLRQKYNYYMNLEKSLEENTCLLYTSDAADDAPRV